REYIRDQGGVEATRVFTRMWLSLFGLWSWDDIPALPPEVIFLPEWFPLNIYDFACWARQTIVALTVVGAHRPVRPIPIGLDGLEGFTIWEGRGTSEAVRRLEACQSPVWDSALAVIALADAGVRAEDPALVRASDWILDEEIKVRGDWSVRRPRLDPGGWAFEFANDTYPDIDDTAEVVLALRRVAHPDAER